MLKYSDWDYCNPTMISGKIHQLMFCKKDLKSLDKSDPNNARHIKLLEETITHILTKLEELFKENRINFNEYCESHVKKYIEKNDLPFNSIEKRFKRFLDWEKINETKGTVKYFKSLLLLKDIKDGKYD